MPGENSAVFPPAVKGKEEISSRDGGKTDPPEHYQQSSSARSFLLFPGCAFRIVARGAGTRSACLSV